MNQTHLQPVGHPNKRDLLCGDLIPKPTCTGHFPFFPHSPLGSNMFGLALHSHKTKAFTIFGTAAFEFLFPECVAPPLESESVAFDFKHLLHPCRADCHSPSQTTSANTPGKLPVYSAPLPPSLRKSYPERMAQTQHSYKTAPTAN